MQVQGFISKIELNDLINRYLEDLNNLILKLQKEVLNTYYIPNEPEKKLSQNIALGLELDLKPFQTLLNKEEVVKGNKNKVPNNYQNL
ncbi:10972_t:CDS:2 [Gigaspora margarita]|uniref:10972_t:CDS:1 n=1 Tax=Gigaspora margarita TaxID=4874 RepID=A0ABM8VZM8_GIGMA|nr:10972_t:CDS:2 [Gigaspora margarita]